MRCPVCGATVEQPWTGRPRIYCCQAHRQKAYEQRHWRPLGHELFPDQPSPLRMLADEGVQLAPLRLVDTLYERSRSR